MSLRPDFERTATGYRWLDWLTEPYWRWLTWYHRRKLNRILGRGDRQRGEAIMRAVAEEVLGRGREER